MDVRAPPTLGFGLNKEECGKKIMISIVDVVKFIPFVSHYGKNIK